MYAAPRAIETQILAFKPERHLKMSHILCAMLACAPLTFEARAAASTADGPSSMAAVNVGEAAGGAASGGAASGRNAGTKRARIGDPGSNQAGARTDRLHSLLNAKAR